MAYCGEAKWVASRESAAFTQGDWGWLLERPCEATLIGPKVCRYKDYDRGERE